MSWFDRVLDAVQTAAAIGERVERLGGRAGQVGRQNTPVVRTPT
jgi:hypothetical protein